MAAKAPAPLRPAILIMNCSELSALAAAFVGRGWSGTGIAVAVVGVVESLELPADTVAIVVDLRLMLCYVRRTTLGTYNSHTTTTFRGFYLGGPEVQVFKHMKRPPQVLAVGRSMQSPGTVSKNTNYTLPTKLCLFVT